MPKKAKERIAEQRYAKRARELAAKRKKRTRGNTPWKNFFTSGVGATIETELAKTSIRAIVNTYGTRLGKRFSCSYEEKENSILVKIETVKRRDDNDC
jgi:hypothetical protein